MTNPCTAARGAATVAVLHGPGRSHSIPLVLGEVWNVTTWRVKLPRPAPAREPTPSGRPRSGWQGVLTVLRGIVDVLDRAQLAEPIDGFEQVAQLIYLKLLDEPGKGPRIFAGMTARFRWSRFRSLEPVERHRFVKDHVLSYLGSLVNEEPGVAEYFRDATVKIEDPYAFCRIVDAIDTIEFPSLKPDEMGRILEFLFAERKYSGEFRTPQHVRALMVSLVDPAKGETVYDPACGTGGFLTDAVSHVLAKSSSEPTEIPIYGHDWPIVKGGPRLQMCKLEGGMLADRSHLGRLIYGNDISRRMIRIASLNLALQNIGPANVRRASSLSNVGGLSPTEMDRKYDVILCAPAFGDAPSYESIRTDLPIPSTRRELLFFEIAIESLAPGGRCAIIVPENVLFSEGSTFVEVRRRLFFTCEVLAVISLPTAVFRPYSAVKTSVVVFRRPVGGPPRNDHVWFFEIEHDGYDMDRNPQPEDNDIPELQDRWQRFAASRHRKPPGPEFGSGRFVEETARCWWARRAAIEGNRFDLSAQRYKPRPHDVTWPSPEEKLRALSKAGVSFRRGTRVMRASLIADAVPRGWSRDVGREKLGALVNDFIGRTPSTTDPSYWGSGFPWVSPKDMKRLVIRDTQDHVTQRAIEKHPTAFVEKPGSVLVVLRSMILVHSFPIAVTAVPLMISQDVIALCPKELARIDGWYLFAYLKSIEELILAHTRVTGNGGRSLPREVLLDLDIPIPPADLRARIAQAMQQYVALVDTTDEIRRNIDTLFPSMLRNMFNG